MGYDNTLANLVVGIATELNWRLDQPSNGDRPTIGSKDGRYHIRIAYVWNNPAKIEIDGVYPHTKKGESVTWRIDQPKIACSVNRGAAAIAKDIRRRFFPPYFETMEEAEARVAAADEENARHEALIARFATILGQQPDKYHNDHFYLYGDKLHATATVYSSSVRLDLHSLTPDLAEQICLLLAPHLRPEPRR